MFNHLNRHLFIDDVDNPYSHPDHKPFEWIRSRQVGGRSVLWGGVTLRMSDYEFGAARSDGHGEPWPISHADLARYYERAEQFLGVCGARDGLPQLPDGCFAPPMPMTGGERRLAVAVGECFPERRVVHGRGVLRRDEVIWPPGSSQAGTLAAAEATGRLTLRADAIVRRIEIDDRRARGVTFVDGGTEQTIEARLIVLCASTLESTRILLNSDLPDRSGALGRYLMDHPSLTFFGTAPDLEDAREPFDGAHSIYVPRFRNLDGGERFLRGYGIWGGVQRRGCEGAYLLASAEMLPRPENRVTLDRDRRDAWGIPILHIECEYSDNEHALLDDARKAVREMMRAAGFEISLELPVIPPGGFVHEVGTARMGSDPERSVLNPFNQCWEVPNLLVTDGACFVSSGCQNPTLTMIALTIRACEHAAAAIARGEL